MMNRIFIFTVVCLFIWHQMPLAEATNDDLAELSSLASLDGKAYIDARNQWLQTRTTLIDLNQAEAKGWAEGLLGLILNARIAEPELFQNWDKSGFAIDRIGRPVWRPNPSPPIYPRNLVLDRYFYIYTIEASWKFRSNNKYMERGINWKHLHTIGIWPKYVMDRKNQYLVTIRKKEVLPGSLELWRKIESGCRHPRLQAVAGAALVFAVDESETTRKLLEDRLKSSTVSEIAKKGILNALERKRPKHTDTILINSYPGWKNDPNLAIIGLPTLANQPDPAGRNIVRQIMMEPNQQEEIRAIAITSISGSRNARDDDDINLLNQIITNTDSLILKRKSASALIGYPYALTRPVVYPALATQTDPEILHSLLYAVYRGRTHATEEDIGQLKAIIQKPEFAEKAIRSQAEETLHNLRKQLNMIEN